MDLHQVIERALARQWTLIDDRDYRDKSAVNRALKRVQQLNTFVNNGLIVSQCYQKKLRTLMKYIEALASYDFFSEEVLEKFGPEVGPFPREEDTASILAWMRRVQGMDL